MAERIVSESMSPKHVVSVGPQASIMEAACLMTKANCSSVLVVDAAGNLQGIVTERDLMTRVVARALNPEKTEVSAVMTPQPCCVGPDMLVSDAVLMMIEHGFRHLPILSPTRKVLGVIAVRDASPRELLDAVSLAEFHEQVNDALG